MSSWFAVQTDSIAMAVGFQYVKDSTQSMFQAILWQKKSNEQQLWLHDYETSSEHSLSIMTQWGKHKTVIL